MKTLITTTSLSFMLIFSSVGYTQNFDSNRMNRDINIMENILDELFRYSQKVEADEKHVFVSIDGANSNRTKGTYLPGYGVIFQISKPGMTGIRSFHVDNTGGDSNYSFFYRTDDEDSNEDEEKKPLINEETVIQRISEFLRDYAVNISQLADDEKVMVIYGSDPANFRFFSVSTYMRNSDGDKEESELISVVATKKVLDDYRSRQINEEAFMDRLVVEKSQPKEEADLKVLSNIFKTALTDVPNHSFRISGDVDYLYLDNFGVLYSMKVYYDRDVRLKVIPDAKATYTIKGRTTLVSFEQDSANVAQRIEKREELEAKTKEAYQKLKDDIKQYLVDYGRTLRSLNSDQHIWLNVTISQNWASMDLPEMVEFQIKKSVLEQYDKRAISREQALNEIQISEH